MLGSNVGHSSFYLFTTGRGITGGHFLINDPRFLTEFRGSSYRRKRLRVMKSKCFSKSYSVVDLTLFF